MRESKMFRDLKNFSPDRGCFACGEDNPVGLKMQFRTDGEIVTSRVTLPENLCGWSRLAHGGILSTLLDEIMSWTAIHLLESLILTKSMQVEYLKPVLVSKTLIVQGQVLQKNSDREATVRGELFDADGMQLCARSIGQFALFSAKMMRRFGILDEDTIKGYENHFSKG